MTAIDLRYFFCFFFFSARTVSPQTTNAKCDARVVANQRPELKKASLHGFKQKESLLTVGTFSNLVCAEIRWKTYYNSNGITSITVGGLDKKRKWIS